MRTTEREIMIGLKPSNIPGDDREKINSKANEGKYFLFLRSTETDARRCSGIVQFCKGYRKTPVQEALFTKVAGLSSATLVKNDSSAGLFL